MRTEISRTAGDNLNDLRVYISDDIVTLDLTGAG